MNIKINLYEIRTKQGLSLRQLAEISQVSKSEINDIENKGKMPRTDTLCKLAKALNVTLDELVTYK